MSQTRTAATAGPKQGGSFRRAALTTTPIALVGSLALTLGVGEAAQAADRHVVEPGDTVTGIAIRNGLQTRDILAWNGLRDATIHPGQKLRLTAPASGASAAEASSSGASSSGGTHTVGQGDTLWTIAQEHGISLDALVKANGLKASSVIFPGQKLKLSGTAPSGGSGSSGAKHSGAKGASSGSSSSGGATHTVASGETLWSIAREHGTSVNAILEANDLGRSATIFPGQKLRVSGSGGSSQAAKPAGSSGQESDGSTSKTHTVSSGDTLWGIAAEHGTSVAAILEANGLSSGAIIYPGQKLKLEGGDSGGGSSEAPAEGTSQLTASLDDEQLGNAKLIIRTGREIGASDRAIATALATAMVESSMRNVSYGDRDSLGLFQQRPSQGWGTRDQLTDPHRATRVFYGGAHDPNGGKTRGLYDIPDWEGMSFGAAAQAVQVSAHPGRYARWETQAYRWLNELG
ncbi:MAG: LysM peptidoglycan-binding domain-containing protein [Microbacterium sp.]